MTEIIKLAIAGLVALHQYLPSSKEEAKKNYPYLSNPEVAASYKITDNLSSLDQTGTLIAANNTCRFMMELVVPQFAGQIGGRAAGMLFEQALKRKKAVKFIQSFVGVKIDPTKMGSSKEEVRKLLGNICAKDFSPSFFTKEQAAEIDQFIKKEIHVLNSKNFKSLGNLKFLSSVELVDRNEKSMGHLYPKGREYLKYHQIPSVVVDAIKATEDSQFDNHDGVSIKSILRSAKETMSSGGKTASGASTLTMQLLKNLYFADWSAPKKAEYSNPQVRKILRKVREWYWAKPFERAMANQLDNQSVASLSDLPLGFEDESLSSYVNQRSNDKKLGKAKVIETYINIVVFGSGIRGLSQAAYDIFGWDGKSHLKNIFGPAEAAFLAAALKSPARYSNPRYYHAKKKSTLSRRNDYVLPQMHRLGIIDKKQLAEELEKPLPQWTRSREEDSSTLVFSYLRSHARRTFNKLNFSGDRRWTGLKLKSTVDSDLQKAVFETTKKYLDGKDKAQYRLNRVRQAFDDRGNVAMPDERDLRDVKDLVKELELGLFHHSNQSLIFSAINLGQLKKKSRFYKNFEALDLLIDESSELEDKTDLINFQGDVQKLLKQTPAKLGSLTLVEISDGDCGALEFKESKDSEEEETPSFKRLNQKRNKKISQLDLGNLCVSVLEKNALPKDAKKQLAELEKTIFEKMTSNILERIGQFPPRKHMIPALMDGRSESNPLLLKNGKRASLKSSHKKYLLQKMKSSIMKEPSDRFEVGQLVWLKPNSVGGKSKDKKKVKESGAYMLETEKLQAAIVVMASKDSVVNGQQVKAGEVLATFGGYDPTISYFDRATQSVRQPGSALKPWAYLAALQRGLHLYSDLPNDRRAAVRGCDGLLFDEPNKGRGGGSVALSRGLFKSMNKPTFSLLNKIGSNSCQNIKDMGNYFKDLGLIDNPLPFPTMVLGAQEVNVLDLVSSYTHFSRGVINNSVNIISPKFYTTLVDGGREKANGWMTEMRTTPMIRGGQGIISATPKIQRQLMKVANSGGTASSMPGWLYRNMKNLRKTCLNRSGRKQYCFGGKTGTTNSSKDTWFVGFSRDFVIGVWVGYDNPEPMPGQTGGKMAAPLFQKVVEASYQNEQWLIPQPKPVMDKSQMAVCRCASKRYSGNDFDYYVWSEKGHWVLVNGEKYGSSGGGNTYSDNQDDRRKCNEKLRSNRSYFLGKAACAGGIE